MRSTAAPYTESRLTRSVANERVGFPVVEQAVIRHFVFFPLTECALKNIPRLLSERQKLAMCTEYAVKNLLRVLSMW